MEFPFSSSFAVTDMCVERSALGSLRPLRGSRLTALSQPDRLRRQANHGDYGDLPQS